MTMLVSLLQLMGFPAAKPVHSRAEENTSPATVSSAKAIQVKQKGNAVFALPVQELPARRSHVKAQAIKNKATTKKAAVAVKSAMPAKSAIKPAVTKKVSVTNSAAKSVAQKGAAKSAAPVKAKVVKPGKASPTLQTKKASVTATPKKSAQVAKTVRPTQPASTVKSAKPTATTKAAKPAPAKTAQSGKTSPVVVSPIKKKSESVSMPPPVSAKSAPAVKPAAKASGPEFHMTPSGVPVRSGRPSSRLAQLTVPSIAQAVASTAAKSSFTQITTVLPIVPPLASATKRNPKLANNWKTKPVDKLSDEEVIAMSDNDYMNDTQLAYFKLKLITLKNDILSSAGATTEHLREDTVVVPDPADRATIEEEHALELRTRDRERKLLKKIEQSISRIDAGDYGYCDETGEPIGVGRLLARPTATLSLEAQQRRELKQKMFGD
jgi:DnaK suppressor protein